MTKRVMWMIGAAVALATGGAVGTWAGASAFAWVWAYPYLSLAPVFLLPIVLAAVAWIVRVTGGAARRGMRGSDESGGGWRIVLPPTGAVCLVTLGFLIAVFRNPGPDAPEHIWGWLKTYAMLLPPALGVWLTAASLIPRIIRYAPGPRVRTIKEALVRAALFACAFISVVTTVGIIFVLATESVGFFRQVSIADYFTGTKWAPHDVNQKFGILPLVSGTFLVAGGALLIAGPIGLGSALFLSEYAPHRLRGALKPILEILAGVPTVVYGYFALTFITPYILRPLFPGIDNSNALSAAIVVGIMIIPTVSSLCDDALRAVPRTLREAAYALSATKMEVSVRIVLPGALSGVVAAMLLALARAIGETMAVALAAGMTPNLTLNPLKSIQTMTGYIVQVSLGDTPADSLEFQTIFAVGLTLFAITLVVNIVASRVLARFREVYE